MNPLVQSNRQVNQENHHIKPVSSVELLLQGETNEFANIPSQEDEGDHPASTIAACDLVHSILDQVAWDDAPPSNEAVLTDGEEPPSFYSRQCHIQPSLARQSHAYVTNDSVGPLDPLQAWEQTYTSHTTPSQVKMGNVTLSTLCSRTIDNLGQPSLATKSCRSKKKNSKAGLDELNPRHKKKLGSWLRRKRSGRNIEENHFAEIDIPRAETIGESDENPLIFESSQMADQENGFASNRLQLFGSEYARHLSATALAPMEKNVNRGPTIPRPVINRRRNLLPFINDIEDAELPVLTGAITDLIITIGDDPPPKGYNRVSKSVHGHKIILRSRKTPAYLNVKKETNWDRAAQRPCVTGLALIFPGRKEFVPPGFSVVLTHSSASRGKSGKTPDGLGIGDDQVFLCFRRSREGNPITAILPLIPSKRESIPEGFTVLERTPRNHVAAVQSHPFQFFFAYRQRLASLEPLRPLPLVMSVQKDQRSRQLNAYFSTGGTVVSSRVGRFHIMDRSTHSLLSPSSISNRLSLIEASRRKTMNSLAAFAPHVPNTYTYSSTRDSQGLKLDEDKRTSPTVMLNQSFGTPSNQTVSSEGNYESDISMEHRGQSFERDGRRLPSPAMSAFSFASEENNSQSVRGRIIRPQEDHCVSPPSELGRCVEALGFIPAVSAAVEENDPIGMAQFETRVSLLTPILTACFTRHGGAAHIAIEGLCKLIRQDFFAADVNLEQDSSSKITLLDIATQVVCEVATMWAPEAQLHSCVEFVQSAVNYGCGHLNTRTVGCVVRFYLFVFYFGVSIPSGGSGVWGNSSDSDHFLLEDPRSHETSYLPGGAPQAAILSLKDLVQHTMGRLRSLVTSERFLFRMDSPSKRGRTPDFFNRMIDDIVNEVIENSSHRVDSANYTQLAMHQIQRSGGSELFWYEMINSCGRGLFGTDEVLRNETNCMYALLFAILANCIKVATTKTRKDKNAEGIPRDVASKLMSLEMLHFFLEKWDEIPEEQMAVPKSRSYSTLVYAIRRLVVPCLLENTETATEDPRVYRRIIRIVGLLWISPKYRRSMKLELGLLLEHFVIKILRLGPQILYKDRPKNEEDMVYLFAQQIEVLRSIQMWFSDPKGLLEQFLNFDMKMNALTNDEQLSQDLISCSDWKITQRICFAASIIAETCSEFIAEQVRASQSMTNRHELHEMDALEGVSGTTLARESAQRLRKEALGVIRRVVQTITESVAASKGPKFRHVVESWGSSIHSFGLAVVQSNSDSSDESECQSRGTGILAFWQKQILENEDKVKESKMLKARDEEERIDNLAIAFEISREKGLQKAVDYLIACGILTLSPRDIASFLRLHRHNFTPEALGSYLAFSEPSEIEYWNLIRFSYIRAISFVGMTVEQGLRHLLTSGGFRLPGEAQQVDRLITTFSQCYWEDNAGDQISCPFKDQDTIFILSFAIIMLNTDLHKVVPTSQSNHARKRMTKDEFMNNLRDVTSSNDGFSLDYLSLVYESIEANPIVLHGDIVEFESDSERLSANLCALNGSAKSLEALLRGLSTHDYRFRTIEAYSHSPLFDGNLSDAASFLSKQVMTQIWHQIHSMINSAVEVAHLDLTALESCAAILKYALTLTIVLDMPLERSAFLCQLGRLRLFSACKHESGSETQKSPEGKHADFKTEDWYTGIEEACALDPKKSSLELDKSKLLALKLIDELVLDLCLDNSQDTNNEERKATKEAIRVLINADYLLNDPTRKFLRTGNMWKRSNRSGRLVRYRFFLFTDVLIYAKKVPNTVAYKIHEEMPLLLMKVVDWFPSHMTKEAKRGLHIYHPRKNIMLFCENREERGSWVSTLRTAIDKEISRKVAMEGARKAAKYH